MRAVAIAALLAALAPAVGRGASAQGVGSVKGFAVDSLRRQPLRGALVTVQDLGLSTLTDSTGRFTVDSIPPGQRRLVVFHPVLDTLRISLVTEPLHIVADSTVNVAVMVPSAATLARLKCGNDTTAAILGFLARADDPEPPAGAQLLLLWNETEISPRVRIRQRVQTVRATAAADGSFLMCGIPRDVSGELRAMHGRDTTIALIASFDESPLMIASLSLPGRDVERVSLAPESAQPAAAAADSTSGDRALRKGRAVVTGVVLDSYGRPARSARVSIDGGIGAAVTDSAGRFTLRDQPSGSNWLVVRRIGLAMAEVPVVLSAARPTEVTVEMSRPAPLLADVVIRARRDAALASVGFLARRERGSGSLYLGPEEMEQRRNRISLGPLLAEAPNLRYSSGKIEGRPRGIAGLPSGENIPVLPPTCVRYLVDGQPWSLGGTATSPETGDTPLGWLLPSEIAALEVYYTNQLPVSVPYASMLRQNARGEPCEVVVIWTRAKLGIR